MMRLQLVQDFRPKALRAAVDLADLRDRLGQLPGFEGVEVTAHTPSTVIATVPSAGPREAEGLRRTVDEKLDGWSTIEEQTYSLPRTF